MFEPEEVSSVITNCWELGDIALLVVAKVADESVTEI
jgi:hypothetical protein